MQKARVPRIAEHALIGDGRSAALTDGHGAVDWLCWPRFDSDPVFASCSIPTREGVPDRAARLVGVGGSYLGHQRAITRFEHEGAPLELVDAMTISQDEEPDVVLAPSTRSSESLAARGARLSSTGR